MRHIVLGEVEVHGGGKCMTCRYYLLVCASPEGLESYGLGVTVLQTGECAEFWDITPLAARIEELASLVMRGQVTPCTLREVLEDWL